MLFLDGMSICYLSNISLHKKLTLKYKTKQYKAIQKIYNNTEQNKAIQNNTKQ